MTVINSKMHPQIPYVRLVFFVLHEMFIIFSCSLSACCLPISGFVPAGRGGASIFGKQFEDELHPELKFTGNMTRKQTDVDANVLN